MYAILLGIRLYFAYTGIVPIRSCLVSFTDSEGIERSVRVSAESLYEAAVEAMSGVQTERSRGRTLTDGSKAHDPCEGTERTTHGHGQ